MPDLRTIAIVTDGPELQRWQAAVVDALLVQPGLRLVAWHRLGGAQRRAAPVSPGLAPVPAAQVAPAVAALSGARDGGSGGTVSEAEIYLDLSSHPVLSGTLSSRAERWWFVYGDDGRRDPVSVAVRDLVRAAGATRIALVAGRAQAGSPSVSSLDPSGSEVPLEILHEGTVPTEAGSLAGLLDRMLLETAAWPAQVATRTSLWNADVRQEAVAAGPPTASWFETMPMTALRAAIGGRRVLAAGHRIARQDDWSIGIVDRPIETFLDPEERRVVRWLPRRPGTYAADPFGVPRDGTLHVFFEEFDQRRGRGQISHLAIAPDGQIQPPETVLDPGCHTSYPFLLEAHGETWLIPETADAKEVRLYRALDFPRRWEVERVLLRGVPVSDPTIVEHDGYWWLFGTSRGRGVDYALRVWHAPALTGPWQLHALDPVKTDVRSSRPGGTPFRHAGHLYRPAQNSARRYGGRVTINRIERLGPDTFAERPVASVDPVDADHPDGIHTIAGVGSASLIDGNRTHFVPAALLLQLRRRFRPPEDPRSGQPTAEGG